MAKENIADASKPNAGRMYDYYLGGSHNFEVDRQTAEQVIGLLPYLTKYSRLQRWALQDIAKELGEKQGFEVIVDFASGLPTEDHIHYNVPEGTIVIYSDYDPITVEYAHEILGDTHNVYYFEADATRPEELLNNPKIQQVIAGKKVAFMLWGVTAVLSDEQIKYITQYLYDTSNADSCLVINAQTGNPDSPAVQEAMAIYQKLGTQPYPRRVEAYNNLIKPWKLDARGWIPLLKWHGFDESDLGQEDLDGFGPFGGGHGAYLIK